MQFYCKVCWMEMNSEERLNTHFVSNNHLNSLKFQNDLINRHIPSKFYCVLCSIHTNSEELLNKHMSGEKHLARSKFKEKIESTVENTEPYRIRRSITLNDSIFDLNESMLNN